MSELTETVEWAVWAGRLSACLRGVLDDDDRTAASWRATAPGVLALYDEHIERRDAAAAEYLEHRRS